MIAVCVLGWVLLTACGEYLLHQASFLNEWRSRRMAAGGWWSRMIGCFACPWGWSSVVAAAVVGAGAWAYLMTPWAVVPLLVVLLPALGLGLARMVYMVSPIAALMVAREAKR